jgi:uncharacterized membrane protein YhfC
MVSNASALAMVLSLVLSAGVPIAAAIWCSSKFKKTFRNILVGALIFILFVLVLERSMHVYFLMVNFETSMFLDNPWIYAVYGAFAAGIFEETGRFLGFKFLLRGRERWEDGVAYGIGHGGIEAVLIGGLAAAQNLYLAFMVNAGTLPEALEQFRSLLTDTAPYLFLVSGVERMFALALQVGLSLLVLYAVKQKKLRYFIYAVLYQKGVISSILALEAGLAAVAAVSLHFIIKSRKSFIKDENSVEGEIQ